MLYRGSRRLGWRQATWWCWRRRVAPAIEPASAYRDDLRRGDTAAEVARSGLLPLQGVAQEVAISPLHHAEAAGGHASDQSQDRRLVAQVCPGLGGVLGGGEGASWRGRLGVLPGEIRGESPDLLATHPELRWAASAVLV